MQRTHDDWIALASSLDCFHSEDPDTGQANGIVLHFEAQDFRFQFSIEKVEEVDYHLTSGISMRWPTGEIYQSPEIQMPGNLSDAHIRNLIQHMKNVLTSGKPFTSEEGDAIAAELGHLNQTLIDGIYLESPSKLDEDPEQLM